MNYNCGLYSMPVCDAKIHDFEFERNGKLLSFWVNYIFQAMGPLHRTEEVFLTQEVQMSRNRIFVGTFFWRVSFFSFFSQHHLLNLSRLIITACFSTKESFYQKKKVLIIFCTTFQKPFCMLVLKALKNVGLGVFETKIFM